MNEQARLTKKLTFEPSYNDLEGVRCFGIISSLLAKDPTLSFKIPLTVILNSGGVPTLLYYKQGLLCTKDLKFFSRQIKRVFAQELKRTSDEREDLPKAVARYANKFTKFYMNDFELDRYWPDTYSDAIVQAYIPPKGLVASKTRVVLRADCSRVFVVSNKARVDGHVENELMRYREDFKQVRQRREEEDALYKEIIPTLLNRSQILRKLKNKEAVTPSSLNQPPGLAKVYSLFRHDFSSKNLQLVDLKKKSVLQRFSTNCNSTNSNIYEVPSCKFKGIIHTTKQLKNSIDEHHLLHEQIDTIVADFIQGADGQWYFINLKHLKLVRSKRSRLNLSIDKLKPVQSSHRLKANLSTDDTSLDISRFQL